MIIKWSISYLTVVLTMTIYVLCFKSCIKEKLHLSLFKIIDLLILSFLMMLNNLHFPLFSKSLVSLAYILILCKLFFRRKWNITIYYVLIISVVSIIAEYLISALFSFGFHDIEELNSSFIAKSALTIIMIVPTYFIFVIPVFIKGLQKLEEMLIQKRDYNIFFFILIIIISIFSSIYIKNYENYSVYISAVLVITGVSITIIGLLKIGFSKEKLLIRYKFLQENITNYEKIADEYSELKHNLNNDLLAIRSVADNKTIKIVDEKIKKYNKNYSWISDIGKIPKGIQGILYLKMSEVKKQGINLEVNSKTSSIIENINPQDYTALCDILGICMDNAIEAALDSKEKSIFISIFEEDYKLNIQIMNTFNSKIDLQKLGLKNYSTKNRKGGIGLNYINKMKKQNISIKKEIINNIFIISIKVSITK